MKRPLLHEIAAVAFGALLQWYLNPSAPWSESLGGRTLDPLLGGLKAVGPGAVTGFVAGGQGLLLGALAGFLGRLAVTVLPHLANESLSSLVNAAAAALGFAVVGAAGGAAGQLLRSHFGKGS